MGMPGPFGSSSYSSYDKDRFCPRCDWKLAEVYHPNPTPSPPNPNPSSFSVMSIDRIGDLVVARVKYYGCTNYEGHKILVYRKDIFERCLRNGKLDPHFAETSGVSPVARFAPTNEGRKMAIIFATNMVDD